MRRKYLVILASIFLLVLILVLNQFDIVGFFIKEGNIYPKSSNVERLKSLPYLSWTPIKQEDKIKTGVVRYSPELSYGGINLYSSRPRNEAHLIDMYGKILHTWSLGTDDWHTVELNKNGDLFFIVKDKMLGKLDWNSRLKWRNKLRFHHWITLTENGDIYSFTRDKLEIQYRGQLIPILNDFITIISSV